jgi:hypothetical protein
MKVFRGSEYVVDYRDVCLDSAVYRFFLLVLCVFSGFFTTRSGTRKKSKGETDFGIFKEERKEDHHL